MNLGQKSLSEKAYKLGKDGLSDAKKAYTNACNARALWFIYFIYLSPIWAGILAVNHYYIKKEWLASVGGFTAIGLFIASWWSSKITAYYMNEEDMNFFMAFKNTTFYLFMKLSFLPVIGMIFELALRQKEESDNQAVDDNSE